MIPATFRHLERLKTRHGLRVSELCSLQWSSIEFETGTVYVRRAKGGQEATHPLLGDELRALRELKRQSASPFVFASERGGPFTPSGFAKLLARAGEEAGIGFKVQPHMLRHACGYALANKGLDTRTPQAYLGHRSINSTTRYAALAPGRFKNIWGRVQGVSGCSGACGFKLANDGVDTRSLQAYLGHRNIQNTNRYTALAPDRFKGFWRDQVGPFHKDPALIYSLVIGCVGAVLFLLVDKYEKDEKVANWLKLMVLVISSVAILHRLQPFGIQLFQGVHAGRPRVPREPRERRVPHEMIHDWSDDETDNPLLADESNFRKVEKWTKDGAKVERMLYAGDDLERAREIS